MPMNGNKPTEQQALQERQKFVTAFNDTMLKIWQEQITLLGVIDTGALLASPKALPLRADGRFFEVGLSQSFLEYGLWQDDGTGRETPRGNSGDLGRAKKRQRRRWFSRKYYASVMNLKEFLEENIGAELFFPYTKLLPILGKSHVLQTEQLATIFYYLNQVSLKTITWANNVGNIFDST